MITHETWATPTATALPRELPKKVSVFITKSVADPEMLGERRTTYQSRRRLS